MAAGSAPGPAPEAPSPVAPSNRSVITSARSWSRVRGSADPSAAASDSRPAASAVRRRWIRWASMSERSAIRVAMPSPSGWTVTRRARRRGCVPAGRTRNTRAGGRRERRGSPRRSGTADGRWTVGAAPESRPRRSPSRRPAGRGRRRGPATRRPAHDEIAADSTRATSCGCSVRARACPMRLPIAGIVDRRAWASSSRAGSWICLAAPGDVEGHRLRTGGIHEGGGEAGGQPRGAGVPGRSGDDLAGARPTRGVSRSGPVGQYSVLGVVHRAVATVPSGRSGR